MTMFVRVLVTVSMLLPVGSGVIAGETAPRNQTVLSQNIADKVLWTRRTDRFTLQVLTSFRPKAKGPAPSLVTSAGRELPNVEVWLLKREGAAIPAIQRWQTPISNAKLLDPRQNRAEVLYAYPLSEGAQAVAAVICIDGDCIVRKIAPFPEVAAP